MSSPTRSSPSTDESGASAPPASGRLRIHTDPQRTDVLTVAVTRSWVTPACSLCRRQEMTDEVTTGHTPRHGRGSLAPSRAPLSLACEWLSSPKTVHKRTSGDGADSGALGQTVTDKVHELGPSRGQRASGWPGGRILLKLWGEAGAPKSPVLGQGWGGGT